MAEDAAATEGGEEPAKKKLAGKTLILFIVLPALLLIGGGAAAYFLLFAGGKEEEVEEAVIEEELPSYGGGALVDPSKLVFFPMPEILVNLNTSGSKRMYLKINVELELREGADLEALDAVMPRVVDKFQLYLRELRLEDLQGSAGMFRVKEELLRRVNLAASPVIVHDVLFKELIIQ